MHNRFRVRNMGALTVMAVCILDTTAHSQTYITNNTTFDATNPTTGLVVVGYSSQADVMFRTNPTSPTVALVTGGSVGGLRAYNNSIINISGGTDSGAASGYNTSTFNISGGSVSGLSAQNSTIFNLSGGNVSGAVFLNDNSTLNLFGTGLTSVFSMYDGFYNHYTLSGTLLDGNTLSNKEIWVNATSASFTLNNVAATPEPGSVALLIGLATTGGGVLARRRRQQAKNAA